MSRLSPRYAAGLLALALGATSVSCKKSSNNSGSGGGSGAGGGGGDGGGSAICEGSSPAALAACIEQSRYEEDLRFVAAVRDPGSAHHLAVRALCASRFEAYGYTVELHDYGSGVNVIGVLPGASDARVLVSAHYDHIPGCAGADDNATGVAGVLEAARVLGGKKFDKTLVVACWDEEELGLVGARAYAQRAAANGENIDAVFVYEMIGYTSSEPNSQQFPPGFEVLWPDETAAVAANDNRGDFIAVIGDESIQAGLARMANYGKTLSVPTITIEVTEALKNDPLLGDLQRSDHAAFWEIGVPALFITDTSNFRYQQYHCFNGPDVVDNLDHAFATGVIRTTTATVAEMLGMQ